MKILLIKFLEYLHEPLQKFIDTLPVRTILLRNEKRLGLISSRVRGYLDFFI
jgi:hypothetical protein